MSVGKSKRTLGKHTLMDKLLGKQVGAGSRQVFKGAMRLPFVMIDLTAGDGVDTLESGHCSPGLLQKHSSWFDNQFKSELATVRILVEKDNATFEQLEKSQYSKGAYLIHGDASSSEVIEKIKRILFDKCTPKSPIFITNDPNNVKDWAITEDLLKLSRFTTTYSTLGCNAGGIKRLKLDERVKWLGKSDCIKQYVDTQQGRIDACLTSLVKDESQWAYLMTVPTVWSKDTIQAIDSSFGYWPTGFDTAWLSNQWAYCDMLSRLFLTNEEYNKGMRISFL